MLSKPFLAVVLVLALVSLACGFTINLPERDIKTGPLATDEINVVGSYNREQAANLRLDFGAGELRLAPGAEDALVSGTATYNVPDLKPEITETGRDIRISTGHVEIRGIPKFGDNLRNDWDLKLGTALMNLIINAGAYRGEIELGGLSLKSLDVSDGAADVDLSFKEPNLVEMDSLRYETGASNVELTDLANANFERMVFKGGAGDYTLDFSGELKRDGEVDVESGISSLTIVVPEGASVQVRVEGGLTNINTRGDWGRSGSEYTLTGSGPALTIHVTMGAGTLNLETR